MKKGRIVEAGTPMNLYTRPRNIFTANFVGEANFLKGVVIEASENTSLVEIGGGLQFKVLDGENKVGERVIVAFRPEFAVLGSKKKINRLSGEVVDVLYSGSTTRIRVKLANENFIVAKRASGFDERMYSVGEVVTINVTPRSILVYSYPKGGLDQELALE